MSVPGDLDARLEALARLPPGERPVISVYLDTRWADEQQRKRVRIFVKNAVRRAREESPMRPHDDDLAWVEAQAARLVARDALEEASGVALFAGGDAGLREMVPLRVAPEQELVVDDTPYLRPLAAARDEAPRLLVVFVDGESARLVPLAEDGPGEEVTLRSPVEGRHADGGWAAYAQSRYQRHIEEHRGQHYEAVAAAVAGLAEREQVERLVLAGEPRAVGLFRRHLPTDLDARVAGVVSGARHEPASALVERAGALLVEREMSEEMEAVDAVITEAAKGGRAVAGIPATVEAVNRDAVQRLYLLASFEREGVVCERCRAIQTEAGACRFCGGPVREVELGEALVDRVLATDGEVTMIDRHAGLDREGGISALLRYAA
ncbi:MAG TPA: Vms1/Ankzf1 family peptidyl-tRNA hydrolase [Candidatus Tectomicrobia bacterium]|nr:Vms1/Ankzf1 family peptidyl-tRNA hydrolase [Candidatus Tectomicrobia bacterium]